MEEFDNQSAVKLSLSQLGVPPHTDDKAGLVESDHLSHENSQHFGHEKLPSSHRGSSRSKISLSKEEEAVLKEWNKWDTKLYEHAKMLVEERAAEFMLSSIGEKVEPRPTIQECASDIGEKMGEPISRQARKLRCKR